MKKQRVMTTHARQRLDTRYRGAVSASEIAALVLQRKYHGHIRLSHNRSLCSVVTAVGPVYFIWNKRTQVVVTVLSRMQAMVEFTIVGRMWPPSRGNRVKTYTVELMQGPEDGKDWEFRVRLDRVLDVQDDEAYLVGFPADVELTGDMILELAWEKNPAPESVRDIVLSGELDGLLALGE